MQIWGDTVRVRGKSKLQNDRLKGKGVLSGHPVLREEELVREFLSHGPSRIFRVLMLLEAVFKKPSTLPSLTLFSVK